MNDMVCCFGLYEEASSDQSGVVSGQDIMITELLTEHDEGEVLVPENSALKD